MKIDYRKKKQHIGNIYIWKEMDGYGVGINGTSNHFLVSKENVQTKVDFLKNTKDFRENGETNLR